MATAALTNVPTVIDTAEATTNWTGDTFSLEPDIKVQGSNSVACVITPNSGNNQDIWVAGTWDFSGTGLGDQHLRLWMNISFIGNLAATNPIKVFIEDSSGNQSYWNWTGSASYTGGWAQIILYTGNTEDGNNGTSATKSTLVKIGLNFAVATKPRNVPANAWFDAWTYGDGFTVTGGTSGDEIDWSHIATQDKTNAYGVVEEINGVYFLCGDINIGDGTSTTYFGPEGQIAVFKDELVSSTLYNIEFTDDASNLTNIGISGGAWSADGLQRFTIVASIADINAFSIDGVQVSKSDLVYLSTNTSHSATNLVFDDCLQVDPGLVPFSNVVFSNSTDTGGAVLFPSSDANISSLTFINCDNGVEYDASSDSTSPSFDDFTFDDVSGNYDVNNTSGSAISISKNNGSNPNSYNPGGSAVTFLGASVTTKITVRSLATGGLLSDARVLVWPTDGTNFPYQASVSITGTGTTATVTHSTHGLSTGDNIIIEDANEDVYNGAYSITVTDANTYTYTTNETISISPATGTIVATFAFISDITSATGILQDSRVVGSDQTIVGRVRKSSSSPYYKQGVISGTVTSAGGFSATIQLAGDE